MSTTTYLVIAAGCDDSTYMRLDLTDEQAAGVRAVAEASAATGGGCAPVVTVKPWADADEYQRDRVEDAA